MAEAYFHSWDMHSNKNNKNLSLYSRSRKRAADILCGDIFVFTSDQAHNYCDFSGRGSSRYEEWKFESEATPPSIVGYVRNRLPSLNVEDYLENSYKGHKKNGFWSKRFNSADARVAMGAFYREDYEDIDDCDWEVETEPEWDMFIEEDFFEDSHVENGDCGSACSSSSSRVTSQANEEASDWDFVADTNALENDAFSNFEFVSRNPEKKSYSEAISDGIDTFGGNTAAFLSPTFLSIKPRFAAASRKMIKEDNDVDASADFDAAKTMRAGKIRYRMKKG